MQNFVGQPNKVESFDNSAFSWRPILSFFTELPRHWRLLLVLIIVGILFGVVRYATAEPQYVAVAVIGPPGPSPTDTFMPGNLGGASLAGSAVRRAFGGGSGSSANDPFKEYLKLLNSTRLARVLIEKDNILPVIFARKWDVEHKRWRSGGLLHVAMNNVKMFLRRPVKDSPDVEDVTDFLKSNLLVDTEGTGGGVKLTELLGQNSYPTVYMKFSDPKTAERLLRTILDEADEMIRSDLRRDVAARLAFIQAGIPAITASDQRDALISVMSGQKQLQMMVEADKRFASTLIDPPYASEIPVSPTSPLKYFTMVILVCFFAWLGLVYAALKYPPIARWIERAERPWLLMS